MELGWLDVHRTDTSDPLFRDYAATEKVFQLHQDTFEIPKDAVHLARSDLFDGQAFRYGDKAYGLQFHLEVDNAMVHRWLKITENIEMLERSKGMYNAEDIAADTEAHITRNLELAEKTFTRFIEIFQLPERPVFLGSEHAKSGRS